MGHFLHLDPYPFGWGGRIHLDPVIRKIRRLEHLQLKRKYSTVFNRLITFHITLIPLGKV